MVLDEIGAYLATALSLTVATNLFLGSTPDTPDACVTVFEYGGIGPEHTLGQDHAIQKPRVQIVCRGASNDYATPRTQAKAAYTAMHFTGQTLSGTRYLRSEAIDEPFPLNRDANSRWLIACNYEIWKDYS